MAFETGGTPPSVPVEITSEVPFPNDLSLPLRVEASKLMRTHEPEPEWYRRSFAMGTHADISIWEASVRPFRRIDQVVVKTASGCNLACNYCFEYSGADQSWQNFPEYMSDEVVSRIGARFGVYAAQRELPRLVFGFHGGEPLLAGVPFLVKSANKLRNRIHKLSPDTQVEIGAQTNAIPLNKWALEQFLAHDIKISASVDGDEASHNRHRVNPQGHGTFKAVKRNVERLGESKYRDIYEALLCVIDIDNDPLEVYAALKEFGPPVIDFTLPYATWDAPPKGHTTGDKPAPYADWLITIFDQWWQEMLDPTTPPPPTVRLFDSIIKMAAGGWSTTEAIGPDTGGEVVIRTDGSYELVDGIKWGADGIVATGMNILDHDVITVEGYMRSAHFLGRKVLAAECMNCPFNVREICGGGHLANRYSKEREFDNPSVYCHDLADITNHIREALYRETQRRGAIIEERQLVEAYFRRHRSYEPRH